MVLVTSLQVRRPAKNSPVVSSVKASPRQSKKIFSPLSGSYTPIIRLENGFWVRVSTAMGYSDGSSRLVKVSSQTCHFDIKPIPSLTSVRSALEGNNRRAALLGIAILSSFHIDKIATSVLSKRASFIITTFCKIDGAAETCDLDGGPKGGKGLADIGAFVGLVIADELLLLPWVELLPEDTDDGLEREVEPDELSG